jgi:hypothetical protein
MKKDINTSEGKKRRLKEKNKGMEHNNNQQRRP